MPIKIPDSLPAKAILDRENIFTMTEERAAHQDIRPLKVLILNLMPTKIETETQILRMLASTPLQLEVTLMQASSHTSKNTPESHLLSFYTTFEAVKDKKFDGLIITGAPVETLPFEEVDYWSELCEIMEWSKHNVFSTFHICWGAQAALYYHYQIPKWTLEKKVFGVYEHIVTHKEVPLNRGFDDTFLAPHSRHTEVRLADIERCGQLINLAYSPEAGVYLAMSRDGRQVFATGHSEYDADTLAREYWRDVERGLPIHLPNRYFPNNDPSQNPRKTWRSHAYLLYSNWINYYVYQATPFDLGEL